MINDIGKKRHRTLKSFIMVIDDLNLIDMLILYNDDDIGTKVGYYV